MIQDDLNAVGKPKYPVLLERLKEHLTDLELAEQQYQHKDLFALFNKKLSDVEIIDKLDDKPASQPKVKTGRSSVSVLTDRVYYGVNTEGTSILLVSSSDISLLGVTSAF
jgi:hypothetical protein